MKSSAMAKYLDFSKQEAGYKPFSLTTANIRANTGKRIVFVRKWSIDLHRGYFKVESGILSGSHYSRVFLDNDENQIDRRDVIEAGIREDPPAEDPQRYRDTPAGRAAVGEY